MYLKSIEIQGFKSFANKIVFHFKDGITGIVGPNGSGKSNVGDAVRWVLGEQSARQLRGAKMEDIIFAGTETRKPLGFAYVAITLDNSDHKLPIDFDEVTVARRVYRSGESEYLINGANCRLKDVQELFLDTGIGKEGYSIIGQGQIDKILSGKPEDRRELFDEAAGIVKYKKRQATALKNLEAEKYNISRVNDIISEIEHQIGPLEKQSEVAKVYLKHKEELKQYEVNHFLMENQIITEKRNDIYGKLEIADHDLSVAKSEYEETKETYERLEKQIDEYNQKIEENKSFLTNHRVTKEKLEGEIKVLNEQVNSILQSTDNKKHRLKAIGFDISHKSEEQKRYFDEKAKIDEKLSEFEQRQEEVTSELTQIRENINCYQTKIEGCNAEIFERLNDNTGIKTNQQRYSTMLEQNNIKKVEINQKLIKNKSDEAYINRILSEKEEELLNVSNDIAAKTEYNQNLTKQINEIQAELNQLDQELNTKHHEYLVENSRLTSLKNLSERYEGYGQSIRRVMEQKKQYPGIIGVVADIIKVDKQYETAIEIALGGSIQNIVTDDEDTAKGLIEYLKKNKYGRATFLPLTNITGSRYIQNEKVLSEPGILGLACDLVEVEERFQHVVTNLLGRIIVAKDIDVAIQIAKKYKNTLRIVTLEGDLMNPGGSMSGGAFKNSSNLLSRKRETEELEEKVAELSLLVKNLANEKENKKVTRIALKEDLEKHKVLLQELYITQNTVKMGVSQEKQRIEQAQAAYRELTVELRQIEEQMGDLKKSVDELESQLESNAKKSQELELEIDELNRLLTMERQKEADTTEANSGLRLELSTLEQKNSYNVENLKRIERELKKLLEEEKELTEGIEGDIWQKDEKEENIKQMASEVEQYAKHISELEVQLKEQMERKDHLSSSHKGFIMKREQLSELINSLDKECFRLNGQKERLETQFDEQMNYIWQEYELTPTMAMEYKDDNLTDIGFLNKQISELKSKIKNLGNVNVNAIEDYKNLTERYTFLKTQRDDLLEAEEKLMQIIAELDEEMRKQFEEKFAEIKVQFDHVFKELFGGGKGTLELQEDEDILEAGIRITAQPPGKKLQNMMQLSGGEKALTAISLLFAIQNLKPSPFCLLDEIEAALDDSNVNRFAGYLNKLTDHTQFIIITHRRGTMNAANTLYGITMQEKGVSTLVSVDLIKKDLED